jgi:hypothetical protein
VHQLLHPADGGEKRDESVGRKETHAACPTALPTKSKRRGESIAAASRDTTSCSKAGHGKASGAPPSSVKRSGGWRNPHSYRGRSAHLPMLSTYLKRFKCRQRTGGSWARRIRFCMTAQRVGSGAGPQRGSDLRNLQRACTRLLNPGALAISNTAPNFPKLLSTQQPCWGAAGGRIHSITSNVPAASWEQCLPNSFHPLFHPAPVPPAGSRTCRRRTCPPHPTSLLSCGTGSAVQAVLSWGSRQPHRTLTPPPT